MVYCSSVHHQFSQVSRPLSLGLHSLATPKSSAPAFMFTLCAVATLAMAMINLLPRRDLAEAGESLEEGGEVRGGSPCCRVAAAVAAAMETASA